MKSLLLALLLLGSTAFARTVTHHVTITNGPYFVPVTSAAFNPLGSDFKSEGVALVFMAGKKINVEFPRVPLFALEAKQDEGAPDYFYSPSKTGPKVRVGFKGEKLTWFFGRSNDWNVTISKKMQQRSVAPTQFVQMDDDQIAKFANLAFWETGAGSLENARIERKGSLITLTADVLQMAENDDDPVKVGNAVVVFHDNEGAREIATEAQVQDRH